MMLSGFDKYVSIDMNDMYDYLNNINDIWTYE